MGGKKRIEIEMRSVFDKEKHDNLKRFLDKNAEDLGEDNKDVNFYILPNIFAKVTKNTTHDTAKMTLKLNRPGRGSSDFEEIEFPIAPADFEKASKMMQNLPFDEVQNSFQERHNYKYKGVELALKYTKSWGYHLELEILVDDKKYQEEAEEKIHQVAKELGVGILSEKELNDITKRIDEEYRNGTHSKK